MDDKNNQELHQLARLHGLETSHRDITGRLVQAEPQAILAILRALGAPVESMTDVPEALRQCNLKRWQRCCEPVTVARDNPHPPVELRLPEHKATGTAGCRLELETGETYSWDCPLEQLPSAQEAIVEGVKYKVKQLTLEHVPRGYHRFHIELPGIQDSTLIISAPRQCYSLPDDGLHYIWGSFAPLYALKSENNWGAGDFSDLKHFTEWLGQLGGNMAGTLPLLSTFLDEPFDPSPYAPVSRMFWNEFYLDVTGIPELEHCPRARDIINSRDFQNELTELRDSSLVNYRHLMSLKRRVLEDLAQCCFNGESRRKDELQQWIDRHPSVQDYARFRAATEKMRTGWPNWPGPLRDGVIRESDYDPRSEKYHLYVQWIAGQQLQDLAQTARSSGVKLYLDFPLGVNRDGYDIWREQDSFALEASTGAPPDMFFKQGQNWGVVPMHPERIREQGYGYFINCLRHHMHHAGILRIDHIIGMHRLYWIPGGMPATQGVYVHYRPEELYAVMSLESHRHRTVIVGEDLGLVPDYVRNAMSHNDVYRMYVLPFEITDKPNQKIRQPLENSLACLNTHDTPPFAAFWADMESEEQDALVKYLYKKGLLSSPTTDTEAVLKACLEYLAESPARILLTNLEDLWQETHAQNVPGTYDEHPNWRRKARYDLENIYKMPGVLEILNKINELRNQVKEAVSL